jgi:hypothetical protein
MATVNNPPPGYVPVAPPAQPVPVQPPAQAVAPAVAVPAVTVPAAAPVEEKPLGEPVLRIYSHSNLLYWWPVWAVGFLMALLSYTEGSQFTIGGFAEYFHSSSNLGIFWFVTLFLVILITSVPVRGLASGMVILAIAFLTVLFAYLGWWDPILRLLGNLSIHMNMGAYMFISVLLFAVWAVTVFVFDHMSYWEVTPGQVTRMRVFGAGQTSYSTQNMVLEKFRNDIFRHWLLGLGTGDLKIETSGAHREVLNVPNVPFVGRKIETFQRMIAMRPDSFESTTVRG